MDAFICAIGKDELREDDSPLGVYSRISDPIFLSEGRRSMEDKFLGLGVVVGGGLHLDCVVTVTELGKSETTDGTQIVDGVQKLPVSFRQSSPSQ